MRIGEIDGYWLGWHPRDTNKKGPIYRTWYDGEKRQTRRAILDPITTDIQAAKLALSAWVINKHTEKLKVVPNKTPEVTPLSLLFITYWEKHASQLASSHAINNSLAVWNEFWGPAMVADLIPMKQDEFIRWMQGKGWSAGYISRILSDGRAALNRARKYQEVTSIPFIFDVKRPEPPERALSITQLRTLIRRASDRPHIMAFIELAIATWGRPEAVLALTKEQCNIPARRISLNPDGRDQTKKYRPVVAIPEFIIPRIQATPSGVLITYQGKPIASMKTFFQNAQGKDGLPDWLIPKSIRHTMAKEARAAGLSDWEISGQLGHRKPGRSTTEIYAKYDPSYLAEATKFTEEFARCLLPHAK